MTTDDYSDIDKRLALSYGLLIFSLMLTAMLATGWYFYNTMEREQNRLARLTAQVLAESLGKVSFSGKYQARLLLEDLQDNRDRVAYIRLVDSQGVVLAHSQRALNDSRLTQQELAYVRPLLDGSGEIQTRTLELGTEPIREVSLAYHGGFNNELQGVLQLGISDAGMIQSLQAGMLYILIWLLLLLGVGIFVTHLISRYFALPVRRLAKERAEGQQRLKYVLDAIGSAVWEWDLVTNEVVLDEHWAEMLGYSLDELQPISSTTTILLTHPDDIALSAERIHAYLAGETDRYISETRALHKNGGWIWVRDNGMITERDAAGKPLKMIGARVEITARKQVEEAALQESERFLSLIKASGTGVWEWDAEEKKLWCGAEYFSMLGYSRQDFDNSTELEKVWGNLLHPDDYERAAKSFASYLAGDTSQLYENEFRMRHASGGWVWIVSRGRTLRDATGNLTSLTVGAHINITSLKEAQASLFESQQRLQVISDSIPDCMVYRLDFGLDNEYRRFTYVSQGVEPLFGVTAEAVLEQPNLIYDQFMMSLDDLAAYEAECTAAIKTFRLETEVRRSNSESRWILFISSPRRLSDGHLVYDGIALDITSRRQQEQQIRELNSTLEKRVEERTAELSETLDNLRRAQDELLQSEKLASLGALVAGVSHELNTPIGNALMVASSFEQARKQFEEEMKAGLTRSSLQRFLDNIEEGDLLIERNLERAAELIGSFKQLAVDQTSYQRRKFDLKTLSHEVLITLQPTLRKVPFVIHEQLCTGITLDSYPGPLGQVLINLINNAVLHAFPGREQGNITLSCTRVGDMVHVQVSDDGVGVGPEMRKKIFDPFFTTQLGQGGSGLGLHIVYTLVTGLLGGRIEVESEVGVGTRFILQLPLVAPLA